jgi:hypothetical protein
MGNAAAGRLTATYFGTAATVLGAAGGNQAVTLTLAQLPTGITSANLAAIALAVNSTPTNIIQGSIENPNFNFGTSGQLGTELNIGGTSSAIASTGNIAIGVGAVTSNNTSGAAHATASPAILVTTYVKL